MRLLAVLSFAFVLAAAAGPATAMSATTPALPPQPKMHPAGLPKNALLVSPCIATMGEHWATVKDLPLGPIYGVWQGKPIFTEIMVSSAQLQKGFSYANIHALPGYTIDHVDFEFEPHGHEGFPVPHYDLHAYYISPAAEAKVCPNGIPDPSMKPMNR